MLKIIIFFFLLPSSTFTCPLLRVGFNAAGPFQSDALLVPEHCLFDHIHNQTKCMNFDDWNRTAGEACGERGMRVKSFAMLLPCGIDVFSGVEFVCCPKKTNADKKGSQSAAGLSGPFLTALTAAWCSNFPWLRYTKAI